MAIIRVVAARVTDLQLTLWKEDGTTVNIAQPDERIRPILDVVLPICSKGQVAEVDLTGENSYKEFEEQTNGVIKLFRVAKKWVKHIFADAPEDKEKLVAPVEAGTIPVVTNEQPTMLNTPAPTLEPASAPLVHAIDEIMANAESVSHENYVQDSTTSEDTIIAVVADKSGKQQVIPGMEKMKDQFTRAAKLGSTIGVERFLQRLAEVISKRGHSVDDLLKFMERNDLPIADDGTIVAYKALAKKGNHAEVFVDIHSHNVTQRVGSRVFMKEDMVDPDRRRDCSNGLHVARRGYVGGFRGDVLTIIKVAPEDVIAVPQYDSNKMRVCGYHIVAQVPETARQYVHDNRPMTSGAENPAARMLGAVIRGEHVSVLELVEIGGHKGTNLKITPVEKSEAVAHRSVAEAAKLHEKAEPVKALDDIDPFDEKTDVTSVSEAVTEAKANTNSTIGTEAKRLFNEQDYAALWALKKRAKKSWHVLGFNATEEALIISKKPADAPIPGKMTVEDRTKQEEAVSAITPIVEAVPENEEPTTHERTKPKMEGTRAEVARKLFDKATATGSAAGLTPEKQAWGHLWLHRKECKKSWEILGFTPKEIERIKTNKPDWA